MSSTQVPLHSNSLQSQQLVRKQRRGRKDLILGLLLLGGLICWDESRESTVESALATQIASSQSRFENNIPLIDRDVIDSLGSVCEKEITSFESDLRKSAQEAMLDPLLLVAIMQVESNCIAEAKSKRGAVGLMQVIPSTARSVGIKDVTVPSQNIHAAARYLRHLHSALGENLDIILAAYHAGPTAVKVHRGIPPYKSTREYVARVRNIYSKLRGSPASLS